MKNTKGKWYINKLYSYIGIYNHSTDKAIARLPYTSGYSAKLISKAPEMYEALKGISRIKELLCYPLDVPFEHVDEAKAVSEALNNIESLLKEIEA